MKKDDILSQNGRVFEKDFFFFFLKVPQITAKNSRFNMWCEVKDYYRVYTTIFIFMTS